MKRTLYPVKALAVCSPQNSGLGRDSGLGGSGAGRNSRAGIASGRALGRALGARMRSAVSMLLLSAGLGLASPEVLRAAPEGGRVLQGEGEISYEEEGRRTVVRQSGSKLVVDWDRFDVGAEESVHFAQPGRESSVLNRIFDTKASEIYGRLTAPGRVWLVNGHGVYFAPGARVNVGGLVASSLDVDPGEFMSGRYVLRRRAGAPSGRVVNRGLLEAARGGFVGLAGSEVSNEGLIYAQAGRIELATGERIEVVDFDGDGLLGFAVREGVLAGSGKVENSGELRAQGGEVYLKGSVAREVLEGVVNNSGVIQASRVSRRGGKIVLEGVGGGVLNSGELSVSGESGERGGEVKLSGDWVRQEGEVEASGEREGGRVALKAKGLLGIEGVLRVGSSKGKGGTLVLEGERIRLGGESELDVSGAIGGGRIYLGGGRQGQDAAIKNARNTEVAEGAVLRADALVKGDGGEVIVWAEEKTSYQGSISARGGEEGGDGGFAEVSAKWLQYGGAVDLRAPRGKVGKLLLDPVNVEICHADPDDCVHNEPNTFTDAAITTILAGSNLEISTGDAGSSGSGDGDITFRNDDVEITWPSRSGTILTLTALRNISLAGTLTGNSVENSTLALGFGGTLDFSGLSDPATKISNLSLRATGSGSGATLKGLKVYRVTGVNSGVLPEGGGNEGSERWRFSGVRNLEGTEGDDDFSFWGTTSCLVLTGDSCVSDVSQSGEIRGGGGNDSITGTRVADTVHFTLTIGANADDSRMERQAGTNAAVAVTKFSGIEDFNTSAGNDTFNVNAPITGHLRGFRGDDIFNVAAAFTGRIVGAQGQDTFNINADVSSGSGDVLVGNEGNDIFNFGENAAVTIRGTVRGGAGEDTFNIRGDISLPDNRGGIRGEGGADTFNIFTGGQIRGDSFYGEDGSDELRIMGDNTAYTYTVSSSGNTLTRDGSMVAGFESVENLFGGGSDEDILRVTGNTAATYTLSTNTITSADMLTLALGDEAFNFSDIETLEGGDGADTFNIEIAYAGDLRGGAGADTFVFSDSGDVGDVDGGAGTDILRVTGNTAYTYTVDSSEGNTLKRGNTTVADFSNVEDLEGGAGADRFSISTPHTGDLRGGGGADIFIIEDIEGGGVTHTGNLYGGEGDDIFNLSGLVRGNIQGDEGNDTFNFELVEGCLVLGSGVCGAGANGAGSVDGGAGSGDVVNVLFNDNPVKVTLSAAPTANGFSGSIERVDSGTTTRFTGFAGINTINGHTDQALANEISVASSIVLSHEPDDSQISYAEVTPARTLVYSNFRVFSGFGDGVLDLSSLSEAVTVELTRVNTAGGFDGSYTIGGGDPIEFERISSLQGGSGSDTLRFSIEGNEIGIATFTVSGDRQGNLSVVAMGQEMSFTFESIENLVGSNVAADIFVFSAAGTLGTGGTVDGGADTDTLRVTGDTGYTYTVASGGNTLARGGATIAAFSNVEDLEGGDGADVFIFGEGGGLGTDGMVDGRGGMDTLRFTGSSGVAYSTSTNGNTLMQGNILLTGFSSVESLEGGSGADTFNIGTVLSGSLKGEGGADSFVFSATGSAASVDGGDGADTDTLGVTGNDAYTYTVASGGNTLARGGTTVAAFSNVENLEGGAGADVFIFGEGGGLGTDGMVDGRGGMDTLRFTGSSGVVYSTSTSGNTLMQGSTLLTGFSSVESLEGGSGADTFNIGTALSGSLTGRGGADSFVFSTTGSAASVDGGADTDTLGATGNDAYTYTVASGGGGSLRQGGAMVAAFSNIENLQGGAGADTFIFSAGGDVGNIDGGAGRNTLRATGNDAYTYRVASSGNTLARGGTTVAAFSNVEDLEGGDGADSFNIEIAHAGNLSGGAGADTFNIEVVHTGNLSGGAGADTFVFSGSGDVEGNVDGGADTDTLRGTGNDNYTYTVASGGNTLARGATTIAAFSNVADLEGGDGTNTFNIRIAHTGVLLGRNGDDNFNLAAVLTGRVDGGLYGTNTLTLQSGGAVRRAPGGGSVHLAPSIFLVYQGWSDPVTVTLGGYSGDEGVGFTGMASGLLAADGSSLDASGFRDIRDLKVLNSTSTDNTLQGIDLESGRVAEFGLFLDSSNNAIARYSYIGAGTSPSRRFQGIDVVRGGNGEGVNILVDSSTFNSHSVVSGVGQGSICLPRCDGDDPKGVWTFSGMDRLRVADGVDTLALSEDEVKNMAEVWVILEDLEGLPDVSGFEGRIEVAATPSTPSAPAVVWLEFVGIDEVTVPSGMETRGTGRNILRNELMDQGSRVPLEDRRGATAGSGSIRYIAGSASLSYTGFDERQLFVLDLGSLGSDVTVTLSGRDTEGYSGTYSTSDGASSGPFTKSLGVRGRTEVTEVGDTLITQLTGASTWNVATAGNSYSNGGLSYYFAEIENLQGGAGEDTFNIGVAHTGDLSGGAGADIFFLMDSGDVEGNVDGGAGTDTLRGSGASVYTYTVASGGNTLARGDTTIAAFSDVEDLEGGDGADIFVFGEGGGLGTEGMVDGRGGTDTLRFTGSSGVAYSTSADRNTLMRGSTLLTGFSSVENLEGGSGADTFNIQSGVGDLAGGGGADTFIFSATGDAASVDGGDDTDTLRATGNVAYAYTVASGGNTLRRGATTIAAFSNVQNLEGGDGADTFNIEVAHAGNLSGGAGADTFVFSGSGDVEGNVDGGADTDTLRVPGDTNTDHTYTVASGGNTLARGDTTIADFSNVQNLEGGGGADTFKIEIPHTGVLIGGRGSDTFDLAAVVTGRLDGGGGAGEAADTFTLRSGAGVRRAEGGGNAPLLSSTKGSLIYQEWSNPVTVTLGGHVDFIGFSGTATGLSADGSNLDANGFAGITNLDVDGTSTDDILQGIDLASGQTANFLLMNLDEEDSAIGSYKYAQAPESATLSFQGIEDVRGGSGEGKERLRDSGLGASRYEVEGVGQGRFCRLSSCKRNDKDKRILRFSGIEILDGLVGADTLVLSMVANTAEAWVILGGVLPYTNGFQGTVEIAATPAATTREVWVEFEGIMEVIGASGEVQNVLRNELMDQGSRVSLEDRRGATAGSGSIRYIAGSASLSYTGFDERQLFVLDLESLGSAVTVTLSGRDTEGYSGTYSTSDGASSGSFTKSLGVRGRTELGDTLITQLTQAGTWNVATAGNSYSTGEDSEELSYSFVEIEDLQGGPGVDTFTIEIAHSGDLVGGAGDDTFEINAAVTGDVQGGEGADTFTFQINAAVTGDVQGGGGADTFTIGAAHSGNLVGGAGNDIFQINAAVTGDVQGGEGADRFTIGAAHSGNLVGGAGNDTFELNASVTGEVQGGAGADTFTLGSGGCVLSSGSSCSAANPTLGTISGGADQDSLGRSLATTYLLDATTVGAGTLEGVAQFSGIERLQGGAESDTLSLTSLSTTGEGRVLVTFTGTPDANGFSGRVAVVNVSQIEFVGMNQILGNENNASRNELAAGGLSLESMLDGVNGSVRYSPDIALAYENFGVLSGFRLNLGGSTTKIEVTLTRPSGTGFDGEYVQGDATVLFTGSGGIAGTQSTEDLLQLTDGATSGGRFVVTGAGNGSYLYVAAGTESMFNFSGIEMLRGSGNEVLVGSRTTVDSSGANVASEYRLTAPGTGSLHRGTSELLSFSDIGRLQGGAESDTLNLTAISTTGENLLRVTFQGSPLPLEAPGAEGFSGTLQVQVDGASTTLDFVGFDVVEGRGDNSARNVLVVGSDLSLSDRGDSVLYVDGGGTERVLRYSAFGMLDGFSLVLAANVVRVTLTGPPTSFGFPGELYDSGDTLLRSFMNSPGVSGVDGTSRRLEVGFEAVGTFTISGVDTGTYMTTTSEGVASFSFARIGSLSGGAGAERFVLEAGGSLSGSVAGGEGVDRLVTEGAVAASFTLSAMGTGNLASGNRAFSFSGVEHLAGGSGANLLSYSGVSEAVTVTLQGRGALAGFQGQGTFLEGFANISEVVSGSGTADHLVADLSSGGTFTLSGSGAGSYQNTLVENILAFSAFENLSGGAGADTFRVEEGGSVSGELHGGGGNDVLDLSKLFRSGLWLVELSKVTESPATGFSGSYGQTTLRGSTRAEPAIGLDLVYLVNKLGSSNSFGFTGIDELRAPRVNTSRGVFLQGTNAGGRWRLNGQYAGSYESLGTTLSFSNVRQVQGGARTDQGEAGVDILDVSAIAGPLTLFLSGDNGSLTTPDYRGNVVSGARDNGDENNTEPLVYYRGIERYAGGEAAYLLVEVLAEGRNLVVNPQSSTPAEDRPSNPILLSLTQDEGGERLQTLDEFLGAVLIGGTLFPEEVLADGEGELPLSLRPSLGESNVAQRGRGVQADTLRVEGALETRGDLYLAASNIQLVGDLAAGTETAGELASAAGSASKVVLVAVGAKPVDSRAGAGPGNIEVQLSEGDAERTIYAGSGTLIANSGIEGANSLVLNFDGGVLRTAVSPGATRNSNSQVRPEGLTTLLRNYLAVLDLDAQEFVVILFNPTTQLSTVIGRLYLDLGLFVEELSLYGLEGAGLALFYSQCEEVESCAPEITLEKLEKLIALLEEQLAGGLVSVTGLDREVLDLRLRRAQALRKELRVFLGLDAPEGVEEEEELDFEEFDLPSANLGGADRG